MEKRPAARRLTTHPGVGPLTALAFVLKWTSGIIRGVMDRLSYSALQLVRVCKKYQRKAMARDTVLGALLSDAPEVRAALTQNRITEMIELADAGASQIVDREFAELEAALLDSTDFLPVLERYLDRNL